MIIIIVKFLKNLDIYLYNINTQNYVFFSNYEMNLKLVKHLKI